MQITYLVDDDGKFSGVQSVDGEVVHEQPEARKLGLIQTLAMDLGCDDWQTLLFRVAFFAPLVALITKPLWS